MNARPLVRMVALALAVLVTFSPTVWAASERLILKTDESRLEGKWEIDLRKYGRERRNGLHIEFREGRNNIYGYYLPEHRAPELPRAKDGAAIDFIIPGDAGDLRFKGEVDGSVASGRYVFEPNPSFIAEARKYWKRELSREELFELSRSDVTINFIKTVSEAGVDSDYEDVLKLRRHGVKAEDAKEFGAMGFKKSGDITRMRSHGVSAEYARKTRELNYGKDAEEIVRLRSHGVNPELLQDWKEAGFAPEADEVIRLRNHGLKPDYAAAWKKAGYDFSYDDIIKARNHGVPTDFAAALGAVGDRPTLDDAIRLRQHGVNAEYYREIKKLNASYTPEDIVRLRQHGVQTDYVRSLQKAQSFTVEEIIRLRNSGVPADYVVALNVEGRSPLDSGAIIELRNRGVSAETARKLRQ